MLINFSLHCQKKKKSLIINEKYQFFKKNLIESRFHFLVANSKFSRLGNEREKRFKKFFNTLSQLINKIYKELTKSNSNPFGGTAFLSLENKEQPFLGKIFFTAIPPSKSFQASQNLSGGEKTIALLSLILSLVRISSKPFILLDEIDSFLDTWHTEKIFLILKKLTKMDLIQVCIISLKIRFILFFQVIIFLIKTKSGTNNIIIG
jgi:structural maintenance of chromosome 1